MASIVGIVIPMKPAVELTGSSGRREVGVSRVHRGNRHTKMSACAGASSHSRHRRVEALIFGDIMGDVQGYGWCGCGEDHGPVGTPTGRVGVLLLLVLLLGMRAGRALGGLFGLFGVGVAFGGAGKGGGWVRPDQVILHLFQVREKSCKALL